MTLCVFLGSSVFALANAKSPQLAPQVPLPAMSYTKVDLDDAIFAIVDAANADGNNHIGADFEDEDDHDHNGCIADKVVFATGVQTYESDGSIWFATGPLAELFATEYLDLNSPDDEIEITFVDGEGNKAKVGAHYQSLTSPSWEFPDGRATVDVSAEHKDVFKLDNGKGNVKGLNVVLRDDPASGLPSLGYNRLYRVLTHGGVAPAFHGHKGKTVGMGYTTFYVFLTCINDQFPE